MRNIGLVYALLAYFIWGIAPLYWRMVAHVDSIEIVAHRMLWSAVLSAALIMMMRGWPIIKAALQDKNVMLRMAFASLMISVNWGVYIWAVNNGHIVESAMGYFINPLVNVLLGVLFFGEVLRLNQKLAIGIAACGVAYLVLVHGKVPYIALVLAFSFGTYGALKKAVKMPAVHSIGIETALVALPALIYLSLLSNQGEMAFGNDISSDVVLILGGVFTMTPLMLFSAAAKRITLTALGMTQYLGPTLQLIIGIWIFSEPFNRDMQIAFGLIWTALLIYSIDQINHRRKARAKAGLSGTIIEAPK